MIKKISEIFSKIIIFLDIIFNKLTKKNFRYYLQDALRNSSNTTVIFENKKYTFFNPSNLTYWRTKTFEKKEPETMDWIKNFSLKKPIFWDIGANIGLYSIYAAKQNSYTEVISFEPSGLNLGILERNIVLNDLNENITVFQIPLFNKSNDLMYMNESSNEEGGALNSFGNDIGFDGKKINSINKYKIFGTSVDQLINDGVLKKPNYIKIDVDGNEHLILEKSSKVLTSDEIKEIMIELNEDYKEQFLKANQILKQNNFELKGKFLSEFGKNSKFQNSKNYLFVRK